jgi:hypothetical protein
MLISLVTSTPEVQKSNIVIPTTIQWLEQHPDYKSIGYGIDALWDLIVVNLL